MNFKKYLFIFLFSVLCLSPTVQAKVVIGSKNFTEQLILGEMAALYLEDRGVEVERRLNLAGSHIVFEALKHGDIDLYPEYTGTGYISILQAQGETQAQAIWTIVHDEFLQQYQLQWSKPMGFNNTYAIALRNNDEKLKNIKTLTQLSAYFQNSPSTFKMGAPHAFFSRPDGYKGLISAYAIASDSLEQINLEPGLMYQALKNQRVDLITAFSTDARILKFNLRILEDDQHYFPPYEAAWLGKQELVKNNPTVQTLFKDFEQRLNNESMQTLNAQVDERGYSPKQVAQQFLLDQNLISSVSTNLSRIKNNQNLGFIAFVKEQKNMLWEKTLEHITLCALVIVLSMLVAIPLGIVAERNKYLKQVVFFISNVLQTIPSLALLGFLIPIFGIGLKPSIVALFLYSLLPIITNTYTGVAGIPKHLKESALSLGMNKKQLLWYVKLPLALPQIFAGIRVAAVITIGTATLASLIGAGGLGDPIFQGISQANAYYIFLGAIPAALLALMVDGLFALLQTYMLKIRS